jgi:hypothetical protein
LPPRSTGVDHESQLVHQAGRDQRAGQSGAADQVQLARAVDGLAALAGGLVAFQVRSRVYLRSIPDRAVSTVNTTPEGSCEPWSSRRSPSVPRQGRQFDAAAEPLELAHPGGAQFAREGDGLVQFGARVEIFSEEIRVTRASASESRDCPAVEARAYPKRVCPTASTQMGRQEMGWPR